MRACTRIVSVGITFLLISNISAYCQEWTYLSGGIGEKNITRLCVDDFEINTVFAATPSGIYETHTAGKKWHKVFQVENEHECIQSIVYEPIYNAHLFIITQSHVYARKKAQQQWHTLFSAPEDPDFSLTSLAINPFSSDELFLGTTQGLFSSKNNGKHWKKCSSLMGNAPISIVKFHPNIRNSLFVGTQTSLFHINLQEQRKIHLVNTPTPSSHTQETDHSTNIYFPLYNDDQIFFLYYGTLTMSTDNGQTWTPLSGKTPKPITSLVPSYAENMLYLSFGNDLRPYNLETQEPMHALPGLAAGAIHDIHMNETHGILYTATNRGIFSTAILHNPIPEEHTFSVVPLQTLKKIQLQCEKEPTIQELQEKAIRYAHVPNSKIKRWHTNARLRALMPTISVDFEKGTSNNIDIDRGTSSVNDVYIYGPDNEDFTWDFSVEWDLANLIWNDDATTIDYREKYMVEMRESILHEITQLYFERRKYMMELYLNPPATEPAYLMACMKIDELTAYIDALTGGYLSEKLRD